MSLSLGAIGRMSGENDDTTSQTSLGACHPDESNKHMKHFEITDINDNAYAAWKKCTDSTSNYNDGSYYNHTTQNAWRQLNTGFKLYWDSGASYRNDFEDDCPVHGSGIGWNTWFVVTLDNCFSWTDSTRSVKNKCLLNPDNYALNTSTHDGYDSPMFELGTQAGVELPICFRFGGEIPGLSENDDFAYSFKWKDYVNTGATGYNVQHDHVGTEN